MTMQSSFVGEGICEIFRVSFRPRLQNFRPNKNNALIQYSKSARSA